MTLLLPSVVFAAERIPVFSSHIELKQDGSAIVQEEIVYDFGTEEQHGIFREIPLVMPTSELIGPSQIELSSLSVTDGKGTPRQASYDKGGNMAVLKIGDYDKLVSGAQLYVIRYNLWGSIYPTLLNDRFTWNVTGHEWKVPIERVRADIVLPEPLTQGSFEVTCLRGTREGLTPCESVLEPQFDPSGKVWMVRMEGGRLERSEGMVVSLVMPRGLIRYPSEQQKEVTTATPGSIQKWWQRPFVDLSLAFPFFVFAGLYSIYLNERSRSERPHGVSLRATYLLAGILLAAFSFFIPQWNAGVLLSGLVIFGFGFLYS